MCVKLAKLTKQFNSQLIKLIMYQVRATITESVSVIICNEGDLTVGGFRPSRVRGNQMIKYSVHKHLVQPVRTALK